MDSYTLKEILFFTFLFLIVYTYAGYPVVLYLAGFFFTRTRKTSTAWFPAVSIIIPAHNEEACIERKIKNALEIDYPADKLEVIVASDASTDRTVAVAEKYRGRISLFDFTERRGKMGAINRVAGQATGEILVLTDSNAMFAGYTIKEMVKYFSDPRVGCVSGAKIIQNMRSDTDTGLGESNYWKYESFLKYGESLTGSCVGADGSVYAVRKSLYPFPADTRIVMDDFAVSLSVIKQGYECVFEPAARAFEESSKRSHDEFRRKGRIFAGAFSFLVSNPSVMVSPFFFKLFSHKILRWLTAAFQIGLFTVSALLYSEAAFRPVFGIQIVLYSCVVIGFLCSRFNIKIKIFHVPYYFTMTTFAQMYGFWYYLRYGNKPMWDKIR
ncbi:MAG: hypothetical protein A2268_12985 [Candidatus Raymondbacteria bacterium RifOxyA12_full_50_37]|uniref:Glycosyltransferase 2-like domain-containing protein n=1 Tax=Candidatus Raymondbacteria bacterium RIFOXYD12_FULL_49_13 TaxID=1817890 RepID=A0A1F7EZT1_UNCRA|nr:MAG: hypothetical protein A2268_12985 [Candidatus Raymondbacteria bacterium RifOxyA12_full_50_37]OGJ88719.1 MAG: hypothetical protein A2350_01470 [Candidatus Raymondbacteria bacterium RifOxyB12_full_50_8]OGJ92980.1 MAG: hypothetical protein A2248_18120 [Candidatus Raymondbacteria bacterium RIFOXYA2_FULL_49_16]OGJ97660.1 MAG: hypothetical protein A2487_13110 [Candidatus Raymondbacteria bacterium RifOxyC12_full_50_8]OGJ99894.1 MAG: hypothetical protein A2519_00100 [Candidatus Raymondbacteria b